MGFAWTIPSEKTMFSLFPNIVYVDATMDTNSEGRPLLSLVGKDTCSKTFTILRVLLPNQQLWVFRWVFCVLLPKVYSNDLLSQIKIIVTDGDAQESSQIDNAIDLFFPQVKRVRCGWHIVHQGWNRVIGKPAYHHKKHIQQFKHFKTVCQCWIYSFMKFAYCATNQFCQMQFSFQQITDYISNLRDLIADLIPAKTKLTNPTSRMKTNRTNDLQQKRI